MAFKTTGDGAVHTLADAPPQSIVQNSGILDKSSFEAKFVLLIADSGNSASIYVGPNGTTATPIGPSQQSVLPIWFVDPSRVAFNDKGVSGLLLYVTWGAASERWFAAQAMKKQASTPSSQKATPNPANATIIARDP